MQLLIVKVFVLIVLVVDNVQTELRPDGRNVCVKTETYVDQIEVKVQKPVTVKKKKWCWNLLKKFSCEQSITIWENVTELRPLKRTRIVPTCCDGYEEVKYLKNERQQIKCSPVCKKGCFHGICEAPEVCVCYPGFYEPDCKTECSEGFWGKNCANTCDCSNNGTCNKFTGVCACEPGWTGDRCEFSCENGFYGYMCKIKCDCGVSSCNHITGECLTTTTQALPESSTTAETSEALKSTETSEIFTEKETLSEVKATEDNTDFGEMSDTTSTSTMGDFTETTDISRNTEETINSEPTSDTEFIKNVFVNEIGTTETPRETQITGIHVKKSETGISNDLETSTNNAQDDTLNVFINGLMNVTTRVNLRANEQGTDNFRNEKKESSNKKSLLWIFDFLPGLLVFSSISFLTLIVASMWLFRKHRSKTRKTLAIVEKKGKIFHPEEHIRYSTESFFSSTSCINNPVYLSSVDLNRTTPVLETFKPLITTKNTISTEKEIR